MIADIAFAAFVVSICFFIWANWRISVCEGTPEYERMRGILFASMIVGGVAVVVMFVVQAVAAF